MICGRARQGVRHRPVRGSTGSPGAAGSASGNQLDGGGDVAGRGGGDEVVEVDSGLAGFDPVAALADLLAQRVRRISGAIPIVMGSELQSGRNKTAGRSGRRSSLLPNPDRVPGFLLQLPNGREGWLVARRVRVARRALAILAWTIPAMLI